MPPPDPSFFRGFLLCVKMLAVQSAVSTPHLLFVDDEPALRGLMAERLSERGFEVVEAATGERALEYLDQFAFDIVITDLRLPGIDGTRVIEAARDRYPGIVAIVITGYGTVKDAVDAIKRGASDFIAKPLGHKRPQRGFVVHKQHMRRGIGHVWSANILTQNLSCLGSNGLRGGADTASVTP